MEIIGLIIAGLIIGLLGKFVAPGDKDNVPLWLTVLCGIGGVLGRFTKTAREREADCRELTAHPRHAARCIAGTQIRGPLSVALAR